MVYQTGPSIFTKRTSNWILYDAIYVRMILGYWDILEGFGVDGEGSKLIKSHILGGYEHQITRHFGGEQKGTGVWNLHSKLLLLQIFFSASSNIAINTRLKNIYIQLPWCQPT